MKILLQLFFVLYILSLSACNVSGDLKAPNTAEPLGLITFKANNITYQMQGRGTLLAISADQTNSNLIITGTNSQKETIALNINGFNVRQPYTNLQNIVLGLASNGITQANNLCVQSISITPSAITITQFDSQRKLIMGQFRGTLCSGNSTTTISNGSFYVEFD